MFNVKVNPRDIRSIVDLYGIDDLVHPFLRYLNDGWDEGDLKCRIDDARKISEAFAEVASDLEKCYSAIQDINGIVNKIAVKSMQWYDCDDSD